MLLKPPQKHASLISVYDHVLSEEEAARLPMTWKDFDDKEQRQLLEAFKEFYLINFDDLTVVLDDIDVDKTIAKLRLGDKVVNGCPDIERFVREEKFSQYYSRQQDVLLLENFDVSLVVLSDVVPNQLEIPGPLKIIFPETP